MIKLYCKAQLSCCTCGREETVEVEIRSILRVEAEMDLVSDHVPGWSIWDGSAECSDRDACYKRAGYT